MGTSFVGQIAVFLLLFLAALDPTIGRSVSSEDRSDEHRHHRIHGHHGNKHPSIHLKDNIKYDLGEPDSAVRAGGVGQDLAALPSAHWQVLSQAAQNLGRAVSRANAEGAAGRISQHVKQIQRQAHNDEEDDDSDDMSRDEDSDEYMSDDNDHDDVSEEEDGLSNQKESQEESSREDSHQEKWRSRREGQIDQLSVHSDEDILALTGTPTPALITNEEDSKSKKDSLDLPELLMRDDSAAAEQLLKKEGAKPLKEFKPVRMPTHFESYDLQPKDGYITLQELVNITGARINVHKAFNASDKNGDGLLDREEFYSAPWKLGPGWRHFSMEQAVDDSKLSSSSEEDEYDEDDDEFDDDEFDDDDFDDDDDDDWDEWDDDFEFWEDVDDADIF